MKLLFVLMLSVSSFAAFSAQVDTTDGNSIMCQTESAKVVTRDAEGSTESSATATDEG